MKTLILLLLIPIACFGQRNQLNNRKVGGGGVIEVLDKPIQGMVVSVALVPRSQTEFILRVRNSSGQDREYLLNATADIKKNGNLAHIENIVVGDWVGGYSIGDTARVKNLVLATPAPPRVSKPKTNAPTAAK
jgi:hypothetical protein